MDREGHLCPLFRSISRSQAKQGMAKASLAELADSCGFDFRAPEQVIHIIPTNCQEF